MSRKPSFAKRVAFRLALIAGLVLAAEVGSFVAFWMVDGRPVSYARLFVKRERLASRPIEDNYEEVGILEGDAPDASERADDFEGSTEILHPYLGYVREPTNPDGVGIRRWGGRGIGSHGLISDEAFLYESAPDRVVLGIAGGSVATFFSVAGIDVLWNRLQAHPDFAGKDLCVTRMCLAGYKQPQQLIALNYFLSIGAHFDLVINLDGFNEVSIPPSSNLPKDVYPFYPNHWYARVTQTPDPVMRRLFGERVFSRSRRTELARSFQRSPLRWSMSWNLVWHVLDERHRNKLVRNEEAMLAYQPPERSLEKHGPPIEWADEGVLYEELVEAWRQASKLMDAACRSEGIEYFHFLQPNQYVPESKPLTAAERQRAYRPESRHARTVQAGYPGLSAAGRELDADGIRFKDLTMVFADETETAYRDACCHLTNHGNRRLAHAIADAVLAARD